MRAVNLLPEDDSRRSAAQKTPVVVIVPGRRRGAADGACSRRTFLSASGTVEGPAGRARRSSQAELAAIPTPDASKVQSQDALAADKQARVHGAQRRASRPRRLGPRPPRALARAARTTCGSSTLSAKAPVSPSTAVAPRPPPGRRRRDAFTLDGYTYSQPAVARLLTRLARRARSRQRAAPAERADQGRRRATAVHFTIVADVRGRRRLVKRGGPAARPDRADRRSASCSPALGGCFLLIGPRTSKAAALDKQIADTNAGDRRRRAR